MKSSRQSSRCQRNPTISRMSCCVYLVQSLNRSRPFSTMGMTPSDQRARPADSPQTLRSRLWMAAAIACAALAVFASAWFAASFEDEYAYISQSYYADLFFAGRFNDRAWLDLPAYDLPPLPKYLIGLSHFDWPSSPCPTPGRRGPGTTITAISAARRRSGWPGCPSLFVGALGCVAIFACGIMIKDVTGRSNRRDRSDVQPALSFARPPGHVGRAERSVHPGRPGDLPLVVAARLVRPVRRGHGAAPLLRRHVRGLVAALQVQRLSRALDHRRLDRR